jgi:hypothetical protein
MTHFLMTFDLMFIPVADIISAVEFNHDGELLATGDKGGRVVIFQRNDLTVSRSYLRLYTIYHPLYIIFKFLFSTVLHFRIKQPANGQANTTSTAHSNRTKPNSITSSL